MTQDTPPPLQGCAESLVKEADHLLHKKSLAWLQQSPPPRGTCLWLHYCCQVGAEGDLVPLVCDQGLRLTLTYGDLQVAQYDVCTRCKLPALNSRVISG